VQDALIRLIQRAGLPVEMPADLVGQHLALAIGSDKKMSADRVKFVCIQAIGQACFDNLTGEEVLRHAEDEGR
jgi:3-dehydroquinate synthetase